MKTASNSKLGATILVDSSGMTLYALTGESSGKFICTAKSCLAVWHPLAVSAGATPSGVSSLGVVKRPDGTEQVAYNGRPLYTFTPDTRPGEASGQGLKDVGTWSAVTVSGEPSTESGATPASTEMGGSGEEKQSSSGGGGGYAY